MSKIACDPLYRRHRFRFPLSLRMVEDMLAARGIIVTHQTIRTWAEKFGRHVAKGIKRRSAGRLGDKWHLDEVAVTIAGKKHWLWRAVDQDGYVLDEIVQNRRNAKAAKRLLTRLLKKQGLAPRRMITDKLCSYGAAKRQVMPDVEHRSHKSLNNRASLFGRVKSSALRFSVSMAPTVLRALASLRIRHNGPSMMGSEERGGTILPHLEGREEHARFRTHLIRRPAGDSLPPRCGSSRFSLCECSLDRLATIKPLEPPSSNGTRCHRTTSDA
jgi:putative transposase